MGARVPSSRLGLAGLWEFRLLCPPFKHKMSHKSFVFLLLLGARWSGRGQHSHSVLLTSSQHSWGALWWGRMCPLNCVQPEPPLEHPEVLTPRRGQIQES